MSDSQDLGPIASQLLEALIEARNEERMHWRTVEPEDWWLNVHLDHRMVIEDRSKWLKPQFHAVRVVAVGWPTIEVRTPTRRRFMVQYGDVHYTLLDCDARTWQEIDESNKLMRCLRRELSTARREARQGSADSLSQAHALAQKLGEIAHLQRSLARTLSPIWA
jgi:hypothetical protein